MAESYEINDRGRLVDPSADHSQRVYAMATHLTLLAAHAFILVVPALVLWRVRRRESAFLDDHGREAVNFQITLLIYALITTALCRIDIGFFLWPVVYALGIIGMVRAARAANRGEYFRYPMTLRFLS